MQAFSHRISLRRSAADDRGIAPRLRTLAAAATCALALILAAGATSAGAATAHTITGPITELGVSSFTVQTAGREVGVINALTATATKITDEDTPYVWAGGHAEAGVASVGAKGPGHNGRRVGFDCSGAVAAVLAGAGLWPAGAGVPADNGVISELMSEHLIARGVGAAPDAVTLYDDPGVHIFMNIDGRFFGTSDGGGGGDGDGAGGAGWLDDGAPDASDRAFKKYHFLPSVLDDLTSDGNDYTFQLPADGLFAGTDRDGALSLGWLGITDLLANERVRVTYSTDGTGTLTAQTIAVISGGPSLTTGPTGPTATTPAAGTPTATTPAAGTPVATTPAAGTPTATTPASPSTTVSGPSRSPASPRPQASGGTALTSPTGGSGLAGRRHTASGRHTSGHRHRQPQRDTGEPRNS